MEINVSSVDLTLQGIKSDQKKSSVGNPKVKEPSCEDDIAIAEAVSEIEKELNETGGYKQDNFLNNVVVFGIVVAVLAVLLHFSEYKFI
jgi:hypothetical protein